MSDEDLTDQQFRRLLLGELGAMREVMTKLAVAIARANDRPSATASAPKQAEKQAPSSVTPGMLTVQGHITKLEKARKLSTKGTEYWFLEIDNGRFKCLVWDSKQTLLLDDARERESKVTINYTMKGEYNNIEEVIVARPVSRPVIDDDENGAPF